MLLTLSVELPGPHAGPSEYVFTAMEFAGADFLNFPAQHARLLSVAAARVVGRPHPGIGAAPVAEIVLADTAAQPSPQELRKHCQSQLAAYKVPVVFQFVSSLPLTSSGKISRVT